MLRRSLPRAPRKAFGFLHAARGSALNAAALEVVRARAGNDVEALLREAIASGFAIVDVPRESDVLLDEESKEHLGQVYGSALSQVLNRRGPACALDLGGFLTSLASATSLVRVLDDNGETIFDLRFLDQLLPERLPELTLLTTPRALSENSTTAQALELLPRFLELWRLTRQGALRGDLGGPTVHGPGTSAVPARNDDCAPQRRSGPVQGHQPLRSVPRHRDQRVLRLHCCRTQRHAVDVGRTRRTHPDSHPT